VDPSDEAVMSKVLLDSRGEMTTPAVAWFEVTGKDGPKLQTFSSRLFDWHIQNAGDGSGYGLVQAGGPSDIGGGIGPAQDGGPGVDLLLCLPVAVLPSV
jgi:predicted enzyme related to lactoylglutathione lyase